MAGDPSLIRTAGVAPSAHPPRYAIAVETADGLSLLTAMGFTSNAWRVEQLPVAERTFSVALIDATVDGRPSLIVAYRVGEVVYNDLPIGSPVAPAGAGQVRGLTSGGRPGLAGAPTGR